MTMRFVFASKATNPSKLFERKSYTHKPHPPIKSGGLLIISVVAPVPNLFERHTDSSGLFLFVKDYGE